MKTNLIKWIVPTLLLGSFALPMAANAAPYHGNINARLHEQHLRESQGIHSDQLTRHEQYRVESRDARIRYQEQRDREHHYGHLTRGEHRNIERELNHNSRSIYATKHNGRVAR